MKSRLKREDTRIFGGKDRRCKTVNALEGDVRKLKMNSLISTSKPVHFIEVLRIVGLRAKVQGIDRQTVVKAKF